MDKISANAISAQGLQEAVESGLLAYDANGGLVKTRNYYNKAETDHQIEVAVATVINSGGLFTPTASAEYPDVTGVTKDTVFMVNLGNNNTNAYVFTSGDLSGRRTISGDSMYYDMPSMKWALIQPNIAIPVLAVNGKTGDVVLNAEDVGTYDKAAIDTKVNAAGKVDSVNGKAGAVVLSAADVGALPTTGGTLTGELVMNQIIKMNPIDGSGSFGIVKHQTYNGGESWLTAIDDTIGNHNAIGVSQNEGPQCWINGTMNRIYHQGFKPTFYDMGLSNRDHWNSAAASKLSGGAVVSQLGWQNFENGHTIFDASAGISPSGGGVSNNNVTHYWTPTCPTLMGWSGAETYGVRVDSCRWADGASTATELAGTVSTGGQDLKIHGKRAMVGDGASNQLILNYSGDFTNGVYVDGGFGATRSITGNSSANFYSNSGIITNGDNVANSVRPSIGFHKPGHYAGMIDMIGDRSFRLLNDNAALHAGLEVQDLYAVGNVTAYSDRRIKDNVKNIDNALDKVSKLNGVTYTRTDQEDKDKLHTGLIAQEVEAVLPEAVHTSENGDIKDFKSVAYGNLVGLLVEAIKELKQEIEILKAR